MGAEARRKEIAGDLRRKIGGEAAAAVGELRELVEQANKNMRAIAAGLAQCERRIDLAAAAPAAIRREVLLIADDARRLAADATDQAEALRLRVFEGPTSLYAGLNGRLEALEDARAETKRQLTTLHHGLVDEFVSCARWRWLRRRTLAQTMILVAGLRENVE